MHMKKIIFSVFITFYIGVWAQKTNLINADLAIPDTLTYNVEIRIYQSFGITNYSSLFRMYLTNENIWEAEFYEHFAKVDGMADLKIERQTLTSKNDMEYVFQNFLRSYVMELPSLEEIRWKLGTREPVKKVTENFRGKMKETYEFWKKEIFVLDGESYKVQAKFGDEKHSFTYANPDSYLTDCPEIDELIYMVEILDIIRSEFGIWE